MFYTNGTACNTTYYDAFDTGGSNGMQGYTLFALNDQALAATSSNFSSFAGNTMALTIVLKNHVSIHPPDSMLN